MRSATIRRITATCWASFWPKKARSAPTMLKSFVQTVAAPVLTAVLYLLIFGHVLEGRITVFGSVGYTSFLTGEWDAGLAEMDALWEESKKKGNNG